jgi:hypothetical protein
MDHPIFCRDDAERADRRDWLPMKLAKLPRAGEASVRFTSCRHARYSGFAGVAGFIIAREWADLRTRERAIRK